MAVSILLIGAAAFAVASMGGGSKKSKVVRNDFVPVRTSSGFTLKSGPLFHSSTILGYERTRTSLNINSVLTYQKGNTTFILPYRQRVSLPVATNPGSSLQLFNLHVRMHR